MSKQTPDPRINLKNLKSPKRWKAICDFVYQIKGIK